MKVLRNDCYGGFELSDEAFQWLIDNKRIPLKEEKDLKDNELAIGEYEDEQWKSLFGKYYFSCVEENILRTNKDIIECFEKLGSEKFSGKCSEVILVEIPDDIEWEITEYDGLEIIREKHRTW